MQISGLAWLGTRTTNPEGLARFYEQVMGLPLLAAEPDFWLFELPDGGHVEVFGQEYPGKAHFDAGPVAGFAVRDLSAAVDQLRDAGIELVGEPGESWQQFRTPDGNIYELTAESSNHRYR